MLWLNVRHISFFSVGASWEVQPNSLHHLWWLCKVPQLWVSGSGFKRSSRTAKRGKNDKRRRRTGRWCVFTAAFWWASNESDNNYKSLLSVLQVELSSSAPTKEPFLRIGSKRMGKNFNPFSSSSKPQGAEKPQESQLPTRLLQLAKPKEKKDKKKKGKGGEQTQTGIINMWWTGWMQNLLYVTVSLKNSRKCLSHLLSLLTRFKSTPSAPLLDLVC